MTTPSAATPSTAWRRFVGLAIVLTCLAGTAHGAAYRKGDPVAIDGRVTDGDGIAVPGVTVLFELSRKSFQLRSFRRVKGPPLKVPVVSGTDGEYRHLWHWDGYYNTFELAVAVPVQRNGRDDFEVLHRVDITPTVSQGGAIQVPLVIEDAAYLRWLRRFLDGQASAEERRIFEEMGRPDRIDAHDPGVFAWWYFEAGKVYRFRDGAIEQIEPFDPIKPL
ncbi:MAG: hypothetical protein AAF657_15395 [Acidobacteriota bacterium]